MWFYLNGEFVEDADARVSVTDRSFLYGDGCFEGIGVFQGRILHLDDHVARLFRSARMLRITMPVTPDRLRDLLLETAARNGMRDREMGYLRPLVSRGAGRLGVKHTARLGPATLTIIPQLLEQGGPFGQETAVLSAAVGSFLRGGIGGVDPAIKTNNYLIFILAFLEAQDRGADVAILRDAQGFISEGNAMNVFCVRDGRLLTPMESAALRGITRAHVLRIARELGYECVETNLTPYDLRCADEAFVTSSLEAVSALGSIDGDPLPPPVPGPITTRIREVYLRYAWETGAPVPAIGAGTSTAG